jgi:hypothetical protein
MNQALVDQVVNAVLYEGYILYPYRASARKNRQRFTFGRVYPEDYSIAEDGAEPCRMQTQCLVEGNDATRLNITVRFLHPMAREIGELSVPVRELPPAPLPPVFFREVQSLEVGGKIHQSWQEAVERAVPVHALALDDLVRAPRQTPFSFAASHEIEPIRNDEGLVVGVIVRRQIAVEGLVEISAEPVDASVFRVTVRVLNRTKLRSEDLRDANEVVMRTFASTHTVLQVEQGSFLSLLEPPENYSSAAKACQNIGTWPILVGSEEKRERDAMISSPIILYDYPKIAPESPGDLFDAGEIDEILTLRIMTMTDEEKREMRHVDAQARRILERTEALPDGDLLRMHGVMRETSPADESFFNPATRLQSVSIKGVSLREGDRVRVRPKSRADIMDMALAGKIAIIESIEQDAEQKAHLALVLEDDPGRDLGMLRQPGHRFFYGVDEVEPLEAA